MRGCGTCKVRHELDRITSRFPSFKQLESTSWCGIDPDKPSRSLPSQDNIRLVGVLNAVDDQAVLKDLENPARSGSGRTTFSTPGNDRS